MQLHGNTFVDGSMGHNNPSKLAYDEVEARHHGEVSGIPIQILFNIGTGRQGTESSSTENGGTNDTAQPTGLRRYLRYLSESMVRWADDRDVVHDFRRLVRMEQRSLDYYRFDVDVENGLQKMKMDEWKKDSSTLPTILEHTTRYLSSTEVQNELTKSATKLVAARRVRELEDIWDQEKKEKFFMSSPPQLRSEEEAATGSGVSVVNTGQ